MRLIDLESADISQSILTVGTFDGLHLGHRELIKTVVTQANKAHIPSVVATFRQSPRAILHPETYSGELRSFEHKLDILARLGVDYCLELPLEKRFFQTSPQDFYTKIAQAIHPQEVIVGGNHTFGSNASGDLRMLHNLGQSLGFKVTIPKLTQTNKTTISTSHIKDLLIQGKLPKATQLLGQSLWIFGTVIQGKQLGRMIGYPTANIKPNFPVFSWPLGVYAVKVYLQGKTYKGSLNIGKNPTTDTDQRLKYEVYIHDFDGDIYGEPIACEIVHFLRPEETFDSLDILKAAIAADVSRTETLINI